MDKVKNRTFQDFIAQNALPLTYSVGMAILIAISARLSFMIPISPVPISLQVAAVLLAGVMLGPRWGLVSVIIYISAGILGAPVFAMGMAGPVILVQSSFGYILGFPVAVWVAGYIVTIKGTQILWTFTACLAGVAIIYICGASWLAGYLMIGGGSFTSALASAWTGGVAPFIVVDILKSILVSGIRTAVPCRE